MPGARCCTCAASTRAHSWRRCARLRTRAGGAPGGRAGCSPLGVRACPFGPGSRCSYAPCDTPEGTPVGFVPALCVHAVAFAL
eukprot:9453924-Alexandrium_andersonii.AAC.1